VAEVAALVCVEVAELGEGLPAGGDGAGVRFLARVGSVVDTEVGELGEGFGAGRVGARVFASLLRAL